MPLHAATAMTSRWPNLHNHSKAHRASSFGVNEMVISSTASWRELVDELVQKVVDELV